MSTRTQTSRVGDFLLTEQNGSLSRSEATLAASQAIVSGTVVGRITTGGQIVRVNPGASNGSQTAIGIAITPATTGSGATAPIVIIDFGAEVLRTSLDFGTLDAGQIAAAIAQLEARFIKVRAGVN